MNLLYFYQPQFLRINYDLYKMLIYFIDNYKLSDMIENTKFRYNKIPEMNQCSFVPSPFRHMFEI